MNNLIDNISKAISKQELKRLDMGEASFKVTLDQLTDIIHETLKSKNQNITVSGYKDGEFFPDFKAEEYFSNTKTETIIRDLSNLPCSIRLTNIQLLNSELKKVCLSLYRKLDIPVTVNLYITPGAGKNCFTFHADTQDTLIYQLYGRKKWFIPIEEKKEVFSLSAGYLTDFEKLESNSFEIEERDFYYLPHCIVHKAEAYENELSIHITFAVLNSFKSMIPIFINDEMERLLSLNKEYYETINSESSKKCLDLIKNKLLETDTENLNNQFWARINKERLKVLKIGRHYGKDNTMMD